MRLANLSSSSSSCTGTTACAMIGPLSVSGRTKCTVQPENRAPAASACRCGCSPGKAGRTEGWMLIMRSRHASTKPVSRRRMNPASAMNSTWWRRNTASAAAAKAARSGCGMTSRGMPASAVRMRDDLPGDAGLRRPVQALRLGPVADDQRDFGGVGRVSRGLDQRLQIRAAPREQHADPKPCQPVASAFFAAPPHPNLGSVASPRKLRYDQAFGRGAATIRDRGRFAMSTLPPLRRAVDRCGGIIVAALLLVLLATAPLRAAEDDPYSVTVSVDATGETSGKARDQARNDGERRALAMLAERLSGATAPAKLAKLDDNTLADL